MKSVASQDRQIYGMIARLTVPIVLQNLLSAAVNSADVVMLNIVGQAHISAVSLAAQYASVLFMVLYGLGTGVTMLCSQYYGKGDLRAIDVVQGIALRFSVAVAAVFGVLASVLVLHERPGLRVIAGFAFMLAAVLVSETGQKWLNPRKKTEK